MATPSERFAKWECYEIQAWGNDSGFHRITDPALFAEALLAGKTVAINAHHADSSWQIVKLEGTKPTDLEKLAIRALKEQK